MKNLEKLPSGSYRYRKTVRGRSIKITFDHKPTQSEIALAMSHKLNQFDDEAPRNSFEACCRAYLELKRPVLSPSTLKGYTAQINAMTDGFRRRDINDITQVDVQTEISNHALTHAAKSTSNFHGFISAVLGMYRPSLHLATTLPQKVKYDGYVPSEKEVKMILELSKNTVYHIPIQLGVLGLRRSEICALDMSDIKGNHLTISKAKVQGDDGKWYIKKLTKTTDGKRTIYIPDALREEIEKNGMYRGDPGNIRKALQRYQKKLGLPKFRLHDLRAFCASYMHAKGAPDAVVKATGGWRSDYVMKNVYVKSLESQKTEFQKNIADELL